MKKIKTMSIKEKLQIGAMLLLMIILYGLIIMKDLRLETEIIVLQDRMGELEYCVHDLDRHRP